MIFTTLNENNQKSLNEDAALGASILFFTLLFGANIANKISEKIKPYTEANKYVYKVSDKKLNKINYGHKDAKTALALYAHYDLGFNTAEKDTIIYSQSTKSKLNKEVYLYKFNKHKIELVKSGTFEELCEYCNINTKPIDESKLKDREKIYKDALNTLKKYINKYKHLSSKIDYSIDKQELDSFINGANDCICLGIIDVWDINPNARTDDETNCKLVYDPVRAIVNQMNKNLPDNYVVTDDGGDWDDILIELCYRSSKKESYIGGRNMNNNVLAFSGNNGGSYMYDALYESYIQNKIDSEDRLALALKESMVISESDYSNIRALHEAKFGDKIKSKWNKFIAFIKRMAAKFLESMSNILLDEKEYLEKYKDIILKKTPKSDMEFSYTGNYEVGIKRLINTEIPLFNYATYKKELEDEGEGALADKIVSDFHYVDGDSLSEQFKSYFLDLDAGQQQGKFSSLRMVDLYNFCYNFNKIKNIVDHDINNLESSTRMIEAEAKKHMTATNNDAAGDKPTNPATNPASSATKAKSDDNPDNKASATIDGEKVDANVVDKDGKVLASAIMRTNLGAISEAEEKADNTDLKISKPSTSAPSKMTSTTDTTKGDIKTAATAGADASGGDIDVITKAADKWISVCRALISAKLTACQQIAKDYMEIIRAHVRSYGGTDKKDKTGNTSPGSPTEYSKDREKADTDNKTEKETKEADKEYQDAMNKAK